MSFVLKKIKRIQLLPDGSFFFENTSFLKDSSMFNYHNQDFKYFQIYDVFTKHSTVKQKQFLQNKYRQKFL